MFGFLSDAWEEINGEADKKRRWRRETKELVVEHRMNAIKLAYELIEMASEEEIKDNLKTREDIKAFREISSDFLERLERNLDLESEDYTSYFSEYSKISELQNSLINSDMQDSLSEIKNIDSNGIFHYERFLEIAQELYPYTYSSIMYQGNMDDFIRVLNYRVIAKLKSYPSLSSQWLEYYEYVKQISK